MSSNNSRYDFDGKPVTPPTTAEMQAAQDYLAAHCVEIAPGSEAARYLAGRGLDHTWLPPQTMMAFTDGAKHGIASVGRIDGAVAFIQLLHFGADGNPIVERTETGKLEKKRRNVGSPVGAPFALPGDGNAVLLTEGVEDAFSAAYATGRPALGCFGVPNLSRAPELPDGLVAVILADNDAPGAEAANKAAMAYAQRGQAVRIATPSDPHKDVNDVLRHGGAAAVNALVASSVEFKGYMASVEEPRPLTRKSSAIQDPFPVDALGPLLGDATRAIVDKTQAPVALAAMSVLGTASLATQGHADVLNPGSETAGPISLFLCALGVSGERKSTCDKLANDPVYKYTASCAAIYAVELANYNAQKSAHETAVRAAKDLVKQQNKSTPAAIPAALQAMLQTIVEPTPPILPEMVFDSPTVEGLHKLAEVSGPSLGLISAEGGAFIGGYGMSSEARLNTITFMSKAWDGAPWSRIRVLDRSFLRGRRLTVGLAVQPEIATLLFADTMSNKQGFTARFLLGNPDSTVGSRFYRPPQATSDMDLSTYSDHILKILARPLPVSPTNPQELEPRVLALSPEAKKQWVTFYNGVEKMLGKDEELAVIPEFGSKISENALRLAAVLTLIDDIEAAEISLDAWSRAEQLMDYFTTETLNLYECGVKPHDVVTAEQLLEWLLHKWPEPLIGLSTIYQRGPNNIRSAAEAKKAVAVLVEHGWLAPYAGKPAMVGGKPVREAWAIIRGSN